MSQRHVITLEDGALLNTYFNGPMWAWFGLSYSSYLVLPRSLMCGMPLEWQTRMVALLDELGKTYDGDRFLDSYTVRLRGQKGRLVADELADYRRPPELPYRAPERSDEG